MPRWLNSLRLTTSIAGRAADYKSAEGNADVAQLAEQLICNQQVIGSSPIIGFVSLETLKFNIAGWSSLEARRAHNPKVAGSNPAPATYTQ